MSLSKYWIFLLFILFQLNVVLGQDSSTYSGISLRSGVNYILNKDEFQSPFTYKGINPLLNSTYTRSTSKKLLFIDFSYSTGSIKSTVSPKAKNKIAGFSFDYLFKLRLNGCLSKFTPSVGFGVHALVSKTNYLPDIALPKKYLTAGSFLTLSGNGLYRINTKSNIGIQFNLSLFSFIYRPDFEINGNTLNTFSFIGKSNFVTAKLEYDYEISPKVKFTTTYGYSYFTFQDPRPITILQSGLLVGMKKTF